MTSARQIKANRANARASSGPRSILGKARASQNARHHGLSVPVHLQPHLAAEAEDLGREIAGEGATNEVLECARQVAEAQIDIARVRRARHDLFLRKLSDPYYAFKISPRANSKKRRMLRRLARAVGPLTPLPAEIMDGLRICPKGLNKFIAVLSDVSGICITMDRYERRALSRRKFAIRDLDAARRHSAANKDDV
jgi:hypothetical protein